MFPAARWEQNYFIISNTKLTFFYLITKFHRNIKLNLRIKKAANAENEKIKAIICLKRMQVASELASQTSKIKNIFPKFRNQK